MIECPICKVMNNEKAPFCIECGQRLNQTPSTSIDSSQNETRDRFTKPTQDNPVRPSVRLHSPILDGRGYEAVDGRELSISGTNQEAKPGAKTESPFQRGKLPGSPISPPGNEPKANPKTRAGLRSPLLGSSDVLADEAQLSPALDQETSRGGGLRSPLLRGGSPSNNNHEPHSFFPHRQTSEEQSKKPLSDNSEPQSQKLKSPLLGTTGSEESASESFEANVQDTRIRNQGQRGRLHSPVLKGTSSFSIEQEELEEEEIEEETNVLRSPLLSAKLPLAEKQASHPQSTQALPTEDKAPFQTNVEQPSAVKPQAIPIPKDHLVAPTAPELALPLTTEWPEIRPELPKPDTEFSQESGLAGQIGAPQAPYGSGPASNSFAYPSFKDESKSFAWTQELPGRTSIINEKKEVPIEDQFRPNLDPKDITPVRVPALDKVPVKPAPSSSPELQDLRLLRSSTVHQAKTMPRRFDQTAEISQSFTRMPEGENTKVTFITVALVVAIICKLWYLAAYGPQAWSSLPFLFDQFGQIAVIVCLIIVVRNLSPGKKSL